MLASYSVAKLVPRLKYRESVHPARIRNRDGLLGRLKLLRKTVTELFRYERIELNHPKALEARGQAERLIVEAMRNGPCHRPTMELADFWLEEKQLVHKLFKVLVPRYQDCHKSFTDLHMAPRLSPGDTYSRAILELRGNPFPPVVPKEPSSNLHLHNILLSEARREYEYEKSLLTSSNDDDDDEAAANLGTPVPVEELAEKMTKLDMADEPLRNA